MVYAEFIWKSSPSQLEKIYKIVLAHIIAF